MNNALLHGTDATRSHGPRCFYPEFEQFPTAGSMPST